MRFKDVYLTPVQVAEILGVTRKTVYHYLLTGEMQGRKIGGGWRISQDELSEFIDRGLSEDYYDKLKELLNMN